MHCRIFRSVSGLYSLDGSSTHISHCPTVITRMFSYFVKCLLAGKIIPISIITGIEEQFFFFGGGVVLHVNLIFDKLDEHI